MKRNRGSQRRGLSFAEVVVVLAIVTLLFLVIISVLPRARESARLAGCQDNLRWIGVAVGLYHQNRGALPYVPELGTDRESSTPSPLGSMLIQLGLPDFVGLQPGQVPPEEPEARELVERRVPGFVCPSDPIAAGHLFPAPISYRATTGDDPSGTNGSFAPGKVVTFLDVEAADGASYTAAFAERLVGDGRTGARDPRNYARVPTPIEDPTGCGDVPASAWNGDAGSSWLEPNWRSTLYNHALPPNAPSSCIAEDQRTALMGASSGHVHRVHVLLLDGSVRPYTTTIDANVWKQLANIRDMPPPREQETEGEPPDDPETRPSNDDLTTSQSSQP